MNSKYILMLFFIIIFSVSIFSLDISLITKEDDNDSIFYISNNTNRDIEFLITSNKDYNYQTRIVYDYKIYKLSDNYSKDSINIYLSKQEEYIVSNLNSNLFLNIDSFNFNDTVLNIEIISKLYDPLDNLLEKNNKFITLVANNSKEDFPYNEDRAEPEYISVDYSKDYIYLLDLYDYENITIIQNIEDNDYIYDINCYSDDFEISKKYLENSDFDLNISVAKENLESGVYKIKCNAYNKNNNQQLKDITVNYLKKDPAPVIKQDTNSIDQNLDVNKTDTNFFGGAKENINNFQNYSTNLAQSLGLKSSTQLFIILIVIVIIILFLIF